MLGTVIGNGNKLDNQTGKSPYPQRAYNLGRTIITYNSQRTNQQVHFCVL